MRLLMLVPAVLALVVLVLNHLRPPPVAPRMLNADGQPLGAAHGSQPAALGAASKLAPTGEESSIAAREAEGVALRPKVQLRSICHAAEFSPSAPRLNATVIVFAWRRLASLQRLVSSLQTAEYCGHRVPLKLFIDGGALPPVRAYVEGVEWAHGPKTLHSYDDGSSLGIRGMWINGKSVTHSPSSMWPVKPRLLPNPLACVCHTTAASRPDIADDEHVIPLEDDLEVSPLYYWWLLRAARSYGAFSDGALMRQRGLVGVSLYTPRLNEIAYPQQKWLPDRSTASPAFLLQASSL